ncbi:proteasome maturation factor UMP1 [Clavulina sp. PMI_390]|nr:proteasome maturation factor UMP1 [Clavulina sp. PMI_390]
MEANKLRIVPGANGSGSAQASIRDTANAFGVHDTMRFGQRSLVVDVNGVHPHQKRLDSWEETQDNLRLNLQRNMYGLHMPMRHLMERKIVAPTSHMPGMGRSNIHLDILMGRDETLDVSDFFGTMEPTAFNADDRAAMEKKHKI